MALSKEELVEMIDSTINENGQRNITGKALNLALNAIVEAMGSSGGGQGGVVIYCMVGNETEEMKAHNATVFAQLKTAVEAGQSLPPIVIDLSELMAAAQQLTDVTYCAVALMSMLDLTGGVGMSDGKPCLFCGTMDGMTFYMTEDGTTVDMGSSMSLNFRG